MAPGTISAIPQRLVGFALGDQVLLESFPTIAGDVDEALTTLATTPSDVPIQFFDVPSRLGGLHQELSDFDEWVNSVGCAFDRAGTGCLFMPLLLGMMFGRPMLVGAQPHWSDEKVVEELTALLGLDPNRAPESIAQPLVSPRLVREFVNSLTDDQLEFLVANHPELIGPVDGMPIELRYDANRTLITNSLEQARSDGDEDLVATLKGLAVNLDTRQFLFFDPAGDGRAAEVFGDLTAADNVTVFVPGITNRLDNFGGTRDNAQRIFDQLEFISGNSATIAWLGYDTPELLDAPLEGRAQDSAALLQQLWEGLDIDLDDDVVTTNVGHSYGSLVTAYAFRNGFGIVDNLIVAGSPGLGVDNVDDLKLAEGTSFYALRAPLDPVSWSENFGRDPSDPRFGSVRLATGPGEDGTPITGHSSYTSTSSTSLLNIASVAAGDGPVEIDNPGFFDEVLARVDDVHEFLVESPVDTGQEVVGIIHDGANQAVDTVQEHIPLGPLNPVIDGLQSGVDTASEYTNRAVDAAQRLTSPDFWSDVLIDAVDAGIPQRVGGEILDKVGDVGRFGLDRLEDVGSIIPNPLSLL